MPERPYPHYLGGRRFSGRKGERWELDGGQVILTHHRDDCDPTRGPCVLHSPTAHHMRDWRLSWRDLSWRDDVSKFERHCPDHGTGHPDPDAVAAGGDPIHGCCGCCRAKPKPEPRFTWKWYCPSCKHGNLDCGEEEPDDLCAGCGGQVEKLRDPPETSIESLAGY